MKPTISAQSAPAGSPYQSYLPGEHPLDAQPRVYSLQDSDVAYDWLKGRIQELVAQLSSNDLTTFAIKRQLAPGGAGWDNSAFDLQVRANAEMLALLVTRLNLVIDAVNYHMLGQPGYVPNPASPVPGHPSSPWPQPVVTASFALPLPDPITRL
jgi:hypothetical protein